MNEAHIVNVGLPPAEVLRQAAAQVTRETWRQGAYLTAGRDGSPEQRCIMGHVEAAADTLHAPHVLGRGTAAYTRRIREALLAAIRNLDPDWGGNSVEAWNDDTAIASDEIREVLLRAADLLDKQQAQLDPSSGTV